MRRSCAAVASVRATVSCSASAACWRACSVRSCSSFRASSTDAVRCLFISSAACNLPDISSSSRLAPSASCKAFVSAAASAWRVSSSCSSRAVIVAVSSSMRLDAASFEEVNSALSREAASAAVAASARADARAVSAAFSCSLTRFTSSPSSRAAASPSAARSDTFARRRSVSVRLSVEFWMHMSLRESQSCRIWECSQLDVMASWLHAIRTFELSLQCCCCRLKCFLRRGSIHNLRIQALNLRFRRQRRGSCSIRALSSSFD